MPTFFPPSERNFTMLTKTFRRHNHNKKYKILLFQDDKKNMKNVFLSSYFPGSTHLLGYMKDLWIFMFITSRSISFANGMKI